MAYVTLCLDLNSAKFVAGNCCRN